MNASSDLLTTIRASAHDLRGIPDNSVHAIVCSPPYYSLRSYQGDQDVEWPAVTYRLNEWTEPITVPPMRCSLGLEVSPVAYIGHLILCLREWRRVLRSDGCCFVNLGDSFASAWGSGGRRNLIGNPSRTARSDTVTGTGLKEKDLIGVPFMFAFAARAEGFYLRSDIIWAKGVSFLASYAGSSMPESVTDRPSKSHEYVFLLTKSPRYFWDLEAVKEASTGQGGAAADFKRATKEHLAPNQSATQHRDDREPTTDDGTRNLRTVWVINPQPYKKAHYAVFPERLVEPMIKAATSEAGVCGACGAPHKRVVEKPDMSQRPTRANGAKMDTDEVHISNNWQGVPKSSGQAYQAWRDANPNTTLGWQPTCTCDAGEPVPATVLDPFSGSGTTARVAIRLGRRAIACDISNEYLSDHVPGRTTVQMEML